MLKEEFLGALAEKGIDPSKVTRIYSELAPCVGLPGGSCQKLIAESFSKAAVTFSFEYGTTTASRQAGVQVLKEAIAILFK